jgi:nucleotide-binding universal stress UspA family protein
MDSFKKAIVATGLGNADATLLRHVAQIAKAFGSLEVTLAHFRSKVELPDELASRFGNDDSADAQITAKLESLRDGTSWPEGTSVEIVTRNGQPRVDLISLADDQSADLVCIASGDKTLARWGLSIDQIAHASACSLLAVPQDAHTPYRTILVPTDFSGHAAAALRTARKIASACPDCRLIVQHVYEVPLGYRYAGVDFEEFATSVRQNAEQHWKTTAAELGLMPDEVEVRFDLMPHDRSDITLTDMVTATADDIGADLIVCGARGQTATARFFMGNTGEGILRQAKMPVLCVKPKSEHIGLLKAILRDEW